MRSYFKFQTSSFISTALDYSVTICLTEVSGLLYVASSAFGLVSGGIINFQLNRKWVFESGDRKEHRYAILYAAVWILNLLINTLGLYFLTDFAGIDYRISKIIASATVGLSLSYFAQRKIVFRVRQNAV